MAILFDYYETPVPKKEGGKQPVQYHARVVGGRTVGIDTFARHISQRCTLTKADVSAVLIELVRELVNVLCDGNRLSLPGLGYFSLTLTAPKDCSPNHVVTHNLGIKHVEFRADQSLKDELRAHASFELVGIKRHSKSLSSNDMERLLKHYFEKNQYLRRRDMELLCQFTPSMAKRKLKELEEAKKIKNINTTHYPLYIPTNQLSDTMDY